MLSEHEDVAKVMKKMCSIENEHTKSCTKHVGNIVFEKLPRAFVKAKNVCCFENQMLKCR